LLAASSAGADTKLSLRQLLDSVGIRVEGQILRRIAQRLSHKAALAVSEQNADIAKDVYIQAGCLPNTETCIELCSQIDGLFVNGFLFNGNDSLQIAFENTTPRLLKTLRSDEYSRAKALADDFQHELLLRDVVALPDSFHNITLFRLHDVRGKYVMIMPLFSTTLEHIGHCFRDVIAVQLWTQISDALETLHSRGYAHMDVKPSNICISALGDMILADLGSVEKFGEVTTITEFFMPRDIESRNIASAENDWWMFAVTLCDKLHLLGEGERREILTREQVREAFSSSTVSIAPHVLAKLSNFH